MAAMQQPNSVDPIETVWDLQFMGERRHLDRTTISRGALLFFGQRQEIFTCRVRDITRQGAGIHLHNLNIIPLEFEMTFDNFHNVYKCGVIWRQGDFVGVKFHA